MDTSWTELKPPSRRFVGIDVSDLWRHRELVLFLALRDLKLRYRQTALGVAWALLQPLAVVGLFTLVFSRVRGLATPSIPYLVFVFTAMVIWTYVASSVESAARSLIEDRAMVEKVYFPRLLAPLAAVLPGLLDLALSLGALALMLVAFSTPVTPRGILIPLNIALAVLVALGAGLWLSALNVQYRDVRYALPLVLQLWFVATPIAYPSSLLHGAVRWLYALNPLVGLVDVFRWCVLSAAPPPPVADVMSVATGALLLLTGVVYFQAVQRRFADVI
jgi:lipopolysaccharide transport system permease protein